MSNTSGQLLSCPWCGIMLFEMVHKGATITVPCGKGLGSQAFHFKGCGKPIEIRVDDYGKLRSVSRVAIAEGGNESRAVTNPQFAIGNIYGNNIAFGGDITNITNVYNEAVKAVDKANIDTRQKTEAKGALAYFKEYAPTALPMVADILKKTLGF